MHWRTQNMINLTIHTETINSRWHFGIDRSIRRSTPGPVRPCRLLGSLWTDVQSRPSSLHTSAVFLLSGRLPLWQSLSSLNVEALSWPILSARTARIVRDCHPPWPGLYGGIRNYSPIFSGPNPVVCNVDAGFCIRSRRCFCWHRSHSRCVSHCRSSMSACAPARTGDKALSVPGTR